MDVKKYKNRKLYDSVLHRYVSLVEISEHVRAGGEFKAAGPDGEDVTAKILAQAIAAECEAGTHDWDHKVFMAVIKATPRKHPPELKVVKGGALT